MSTPTASTLTFVSHHLVIYMGFFIFIAGVIGGPLVLIVFLSLKTFRQSSCAFYLTIMSIVNTCHLFTGLLTYIMINGYGIDWTSISLFYCKFRPLYIQFCILLSMTCMCLATIDQFLATCSNSRWHQWNNIKTARYIVIGASIFWILHGIPFVIYYNQTVSTITGKTNCGITNAIFQQYYTFFYSACLKTSIPLAIMALFGVFAYRNVQQIAYRTVPLVRRELDKQLTVMVLVQVFYDVVTVLPTMIQTIYTIFIGTPSDLFIETELNFISTVASLWFYLYFVGSFYIYVIVSKRFRQQLIHVLFIIHLNRCRRPTMNNNQVGPQT